MEKILDVMRQAPILLRELIKEIPTELLKAQRIPHKWTIHEHACHLAEAQDMMIERFTIFKSQKIKSWRCRKGCVKDSGSF